MAGGNDLGVNLSSLRKKTPCTRIYIPYGLNVAYIQGFDFSVLSLTLLGTVPTSTH
ncbi:hypothetical protein SCLCIDRAFT_1221112 [Scleroderma citrinum Foug A]|uniref:Uncharacterized protein n=1 Tax=Scleroderma citrinum Foug A TaxID=1036808 RepID=A0A0C2ZS66_9AGAM|nr:hypothetical protein SCLCIDRAFT_1221112 [Scleroderma citrinum Foug A]